MQRPIVGPPGAGGVASGVREREARRGDPGPGAPAGRLSQGGALTLRLEPQTSPADLKAMTDVVYHPGNLAGPIASGSPRFRRWGGDGERER